MPETSNIAEALKTNLEKGNLEQSRSIIRGLPEVQDPEIVDLLIQALNYSTTQYEAAHKLLKVGINPAPFLIALLDKSNNSNLKSLALLMLGSEVNDSASIPAIVTSLSSDPDEYVRRQAAFALKSFESDEALNALAIALKEDASLRVREKAARSLGLFKKAAALAVLLEVLEVESDSQIRSAIIRRHKELSSLNERPPK